MTVQSLKASKIDFKQQERMVDRIRGLITDYPLSATVKELLQNADDAGATSLCIWFDWRTHSLVHHQDNALARLGGPAILAYNDRQFKPEDFEGIQNVGRGAKATNRSKLGRFGVGFCSVYNLTDYPCLVSGDQFAICDPHGHLFPPDEGGRWNLRDVWEQFPELLEPFCHNDLLQRGCSEFDGTIFRFPLRDSNQTTISEISSQAVSRVDLESIIKQVEKYGASYLLFLKCVLHIRLQVILSDGRTESSIIITTKNKQEVAKKRNLVTKLLALDQSALAALLRDPAAQLDPVLYHHNMHVGNGTAAYELRWQICQGIFRDPGHQLVDLAEKLAPPGTKIVDKAVPWAGVAALSPPSHGRKSDRTPETLAVIEGLVFCGLPLGFCADLQPEQRLPVHIHGFFDLDTSRYSPAANPEEAGKGALGVRWNQLLVEHAIAPAYAALLTALAGPLGEANPEGFYALWPSVPCQIPGALANLGEAVYRLLCGRQVMRCAGTPAWVTPTELLLPPPELQEPLAADQRPIPNPPLPPKIIMGFKTGRVPLRYLTPAILCGWLRETSFPRTTIATAQRSCLRQRSWLVALLRYCLTDPQTQLKGLPLALFADGTLGVFSPGYNTFICSKEEHEILAPHAHALIEHEYGVECGLKPQTESELYRMELPGLILSIKNILNVSSSKNHVSWSAENSTPPNTQWLLKVFRYFKKIKDLLPQKSRLQQVPLIPDQYNRLWPMATDVTPLLWEGGEPEALGVALDAIGVSRVAGPSELVEEVSQFARAHGSPYIRLMTPENLVSALQSLQTEISGLTYQNIVHDALLNYLLPWYGSQPQKATQMKALPIFPTVAGAVTAIQKVPVCLAPGFALPRSLDSLITLYEGPRNSWRTALEAIGVQRLDHSAVIQSHLLPAYGRLDNEARFEALCWIREHFAAAHGGLMQRGGVAAVDAFMKRLREAELIRASDDKFYPAQRLYHPDRCGLPDVLVGRVLFPHRDQYANEREQWLDFFSKLGLNQQPHPIDLLDCVKHLSTLAQAGEISAVIPPLKAIWEHLQEHGKELLKAQIPGKAGTLAQALREFAWLPAKLAPAELAPFPGAQIPTSRLYYPSELHLTSNGYLVASQGNLMLFGEPRSFLREALQIPLHPSLDQVMNHFEYLITQWESPQHGGLDVDGIRKALGLIYRFFGGLLRVPSSDSDREKQVVVDLNRLRARFAKRRCIWVNGRQTFVLPTHAFANPVHGLGDNRLCVRIINEAEARGLSALGRGESPTIKDYVDFLRELQASSQGQPLSAELEQQALDAFHYLSLLIREGEAPPSIPLLTQRGILIDSAEVVVNHDKWYDEYASIDGVHLLHMRTPPGLIASLGLRKLTEEIEEVPAGVLRESTDAQLIEQAKNWTMTLRSPEFRSALIRLVRHHRQFVRVADLQWLSDVTVCVVKPIQSELWMNSPGAPARQIGTTESSSYFRPENTTIYLSDQEPILAASFLAAELNRQLDDLSLPTVSELVQLLGVPPDRMDQVLTKLRVSIDFEARFQERGESSVGPQTAAVDEWRGTEAVSEAEASDAPAEHLSHSEEHSPDTEDRSKESNTSLPAPPSQAGASSPIQEAEPGPTATPTSSPPAAPSLPPQPGSFPPSAPTHPRPNSGYYGRSGNQPLPPPVLPGTSGRLPDGRSHAPFRPSEQTGRLISYVFPEGIANWYAELGFDEEQWLRLQQQGIERVQREEHGTEDRSFRAAEEGQPGYSLVSELPNGEDVRYHLIKALPGPWAEAGVAFSSTELRAAQQLGASFWLHVVEYAMDDPDGPYTLIHNPAQKITQFRLDRGWKLAAAPAAAPPTPPLPEVGQIWRHASLGDAEILQVVGGGQHKRLYVRWLSPRPEQLAEQWHTFIRSQMRLVRPTE